MDRGLVHMTTQFIKLEPRHVLILVIMDRGLVPVILQLVIAQHIRYFKNRNFTYLNSKKYIFILQK